MKYGSKKLVKNTDYTVSYPSGHKNVGAYKVTIKGKGKYSGTITRTFTIKPKAASLKKVSALNNGFKATWGKVSSQCMGYQIRYSTNKSMSKVATKTVSSYKTTSE